MIGLITDSSYENGYYNQAVRLINIARIAVTTLGTVVMPRIGKYYEEK